MTPWPKPKEPMSAALVDIATAQMVYERARAEAAIARLRVAIDALKYCRDHSEPLECHRSTAAEALAIIGPIEQGEP